MNCRGCCVQVTEREWHCCHLEERHLTRYSTSVRRSSRRRAPSALSSLTNLNDSRRRDRKSHLAFPFNRGIAEERDAATPTVVLFRHPRPVAHHPQRAYGIPVVLFRPPVQWVSLEMVETEKAESLFRIVKPLQRPPRLAVAPADTDDRHREARGTRRPGSARGSRARSRSTS